MHEILVVVLPGFERLSVGSFCIGLIDSVLWGAYAALAFVPLHNYFFRMWLGWK